ncbi:S1 family peptidase [Vibrio paucivorans]|uniref:Trypsin-like serine protease n=1 Tax=Vibrio paucivorans TaxID=2829489 RepID=A0A9X3CCW0_9VIBR|nr:trypsin-like serine protease [Vibrio paucivorans]MCW8333413.1 trypsin-like serine protease [Vibrio paucivorans]
MNKKALLIAACSVSAPSIAADISPYIVNGSSASVATYPSFASLVYDRIDYDGVYSVAPYCGATILDAQHVLTAAHCIFDGEGNLSEETVLFTAIVPQLQDESDYPDGNIQRIMASEFYYHPSYSDSSNDLWANDIAIIKLSSAMNIDTVNDVVNRPSNETYQNAANTFHAVGHGNTRTNVDTSTELLYTTLTYVSTASCQSDYSVTDNQLCFSGDFSIFSGLDNSTCQGDSGGPVYWNNSGEWVQVGITSFGPTTCGNGTTNADVTSVFTEIYDYQSWIDSVLAGNETANYVATDAKRNSYLGTSGTSTSSSGGGSIGWLTLILLPLLRRFAQ